MSDAAVRRYLEARGISQGSAYWNGEQRLAVSGVYADGGQYYQSFFIPRGSPLLRLTSTEAFLATAASFRDLGASIDVSESDRLFRNCPSAFWLRPDWSGGDNLRDPGAEPFWMKPPLKEERPLNWGIYAANGSFDVAPYYQTAATSLYV